VIQVPAVPPYVYRNPANEHSLLQGDVLKVEGQFKQGQNRVRLAQLHIPFIFDAQDIH
jgi:hypothetical protein